MRIDVKVLISMSMCGFRVGSVVLHRACFSNLDLVFDSSPDAKPAQSFQNDTRPREARAKE